MAARSGRGRATPATATKAERRFRRLLTAEARSGLSRREFAEQRGVSAGTLSWWKHEIDRREEARARAVESARRPSPVLVPVRVAEQSAPETAESVARPSGGERYEIVLRCGRVVRVPRDFGAASLLALVRALESTPC